jgi:hypothetical protein
MYSQPQREKMSRVFLVFIGVIGTVLITSNFVTFGQSGTSLTATNAIGYGNFNCSWFASK